MTSEAPKLLPCPFCGSDDALYSEHMQGTIIHPAYRVRCDHCGASTGYTDNDHVAAWNTRDTTHALAMVAAEREANAIIADTFDDSKLCLSCGHPKSNHHYRHPFVSRAGPDNIGSAIRARTPDDAQAALDALLKAEREAGRVEGLREAEKLMQPPSYVDAGFAGYWSGVHEYRSKIRALIEKENGNE